MNISLTPEGGGLVRFEGRIHAIENNLGQMAEAGAFTMAALDKYTKDSWGTGVVVTESTRMRWPNWKPLDNTGDLKASLTRTGSHGAIREITAYGFKWGTSIHYAKFLQTGTKKMASKPVIRSHRALRALTGYYMRQWILRNAVPVANEARWSSYMQTYEDRKAYGDLQSFPQPWQNRMRRVSRWTL